MHPDGDKLLIRHEKVHADGAWHSQCLVCAGSYDAHLNLTPEHYDRSKGWYEERRTVSI